MHVAIVGGGAALAQPIIEHYLGKDWDVTAICFGTVPRPFSMADGRDRLLVYQDVDMASEKAVKLLNLYPVDVLITLTGRVLNGRIEDMALTDWNWIIECNLTTVFNALRFGLPQMKMNSNIVVVGSIMGSLGGKGCANYAAAKAGLVGLVRAAANENANRNIRINLLELGYIDAGMGAKLSPELKEKIRETIPLKRFGTTEDVVEAVDYLGRTKYMSGNVLTLAGGLR